MVAQQGLVLTIEASLGRTKAPKGYRSKFISGDAVDTGRLLGQESTGASD